MPPPSDIVKVAVEWPGANAQLLEIDQVRPGNQMGEEMHHSRDTGMWEAQKWAVFLSGLEECGY